MSPSARSSRIHRQGCAGSGLCRNKVAPGLDAGRTVFDGSVLEVVVMLGADVDVVVGRLGRVSGDEHATVVVVGERVGGV